MQEVLRTAIDQHATDAFTDRSTNPLSGARAREAKTRVGTMEVFPNRTVAEQAKIVAYTGLGKDWSYRVALRAVQKENENSHINGASRPVPSCRVWS